MYGRLVARYFQRANRLPSRPTMSELLFACEESGIPVFRSMGLHRPGYCVTGPDGCIILAWYACSGELAHEIFHFLTGDPDRAELYSYRLPGEVGGADEEWAEEFRRAICG